MGPGNNCAFLPNSVFYSVPNSPGWVVRRRARRQQNWAISAGRMDVHGKKILGFGFYNPYRQTQAPPVFPCAVILLAMRERSSGLSSALSRLKWPKLIQPHRGLQRDTTTTLSKQNLQKNTKLSKPFQITASFCSKSGFEVSFSPLL